MSEHEDVVKILADPKWDRGERIYEWPEDEAEAYRELGWAEGMAAAKKIRIDKFAEELLSSGWLAKHDARVQADTAEQAATIAENAFLIHKVPSLGCGPFQIQQYVADESRAQIAANIRAKCIAPTPGKTTESEASHE